MGLRDAFAWLVGRETPLQERDIPEDSIAGLVARIGGVRTSPWRRASVVDAMGVPAVFRAVTLIANTTGVLSLEAYRNGAKLDAVDTPRVVIRPNPFTTPRTFHRDTAGYIAQHGEAWEWIAKRDSDNQALSIIPVDPREVVVENNPRNRLVPIIRWLGEEMPNDDFRQITYLRDPRNPLRGWGPLQACSAALSVAVEAQEWAANFFAGNPTNTVLHSAVQLDPDADESGLNEAQRIKAAWMADSSNLPKVVDPGIEKVEDIGISPANAQLTESRGFQDGQVALAFGIPGTLLEHFTAGSSLTYQNVGQEFDKFVRSCLWPNYLEPIEQEISDLLTRATVTRYNVLGLLRPDPKTRAEIYNILVPLGIQSVEDAQSAEGFAPGDVENRPVPFAPPQAIPTALQARSAEGVRCVSCDRFLGELTTPYRVKCRCNAMNAA